MHAGGMHFCYQAADGHLVFLHPLTRSMLLEVRKPLPGLLCAEVSDNFSGAGVWGLGEGTGDSGGSGAASRVCGERCRLPCLAPPPEVGASLGLRCLARVVGPVQVNRWISGAFAGSIVSFVPLHARLELVELDLSRFVSPAILEKHRPALRKRASRRAAQLRQDQTRMEEVRGICLCVCLSVCVFFWGGVHRLPLRLQSFLPRVRPTARKCSRCSV
jgi:hypothetical protein